jgi:hypothetical protein
MPLIRSGISGRLMATYVGLWRLVAPVVLMPQTDDLLKLQTYLARFLLGRPGRGGCKSISLADALMSRESVVQSRLYSGRIEISTGLRPLQTRRAKHSKALSRYLGRRRFPRSSAPTRSPNLASSASRAPWILSLNQPKSSPGRNCLSTRNVN